MEQLAQKRLHLLLRKRFASLWLLTRVLSNLWFTQRWGGLIILNYASKCQWRWEEQPLCHCGTDLQLTRRSKREMPGEKAKPDLGKWWAWSWRQKQHPWRNQGGRKHNLGLGDVCEHTCVCSQGVRADTGCFPWLFCSTTFHERDNTLSFVCLRECCYLIIFN